MSGSRTNVQQGVTFKRQNWQSIVENLGEEFSCPLSEVKQMLNATAQHLEQEAQVKEFIPVLAVKEVKDQLRKSRHTRSRGTAPNFTNNPSCSKLLAIFTCVALLLWRELFTRPPSYDGTGTSLLGSPQ
jgi:hypothetical protein